MTLFSRRNLRSFDGQPLSYLEGGEGRSVVLVHGFMASAERNWIAPGIAGKLIDAGYRVIAPDLRGHGASAHPVDADAWPVDVLARDLELVIQKLSGQDYDLIGYSLGARTAVRAMVGGARPRRAVLGGMGDTGVMEAGARAAMFRDAILNGPNAKIPASGRVVQAMITQERLDPRALLGVLDSFAATLEVELAAIPTPTLIVAGEKDADNGSPDALAALMPAARVVRVPGDHLTAVVAPELAQAIVSFLSEPE